MSGSFRHVVVVGLMGSGKTTVGRVLAGDLGWAFVDSDEQLREAVGRTAREIAERDGLQALHALEAGLLLKALARPQPSVIGAAGSTIESAACRAALAAPAVLVIWLRGSPETLAARVRASGHRPLVGDDPRDVLDEQVRNREPLLAAVADRTVDIDDRSRAEILSDARLALEGISG